MDSPLADAAFRFSTADASSSSSSSASANGKRAPLPAAHEVRQLRALVQRLERELAELSAKWRRALPADDRVVLAACAAAREKARTTRAEKCNALLRDQLMQQQLFYASLQDQLARRAPLGDGSSRTSAIFASLHAPLRLCGRDVQAKGGSLRRQQLAHRLAAGVDGAADIMDSFTRELLPLASPFLPYSSTCVAPTSVQAKPGTLVSNVFVCKLPAESDVAQVFRVVVDNLKKAPQELSQRLGIHLDFSVLPLCTDKHQMLDMLGPEKYYGRVTRTGGAFNGVETLTAYVAELVNEDLGVALLDFVDADDELSDANNAAPEKQKQDQPLQLDTCSLVTVSRMRPEDAENEPDKKRPVLLRRLRVHRYNLPPHSPLLHRDLEQHQAYINGDLHMEMLSAAVAREAEENSATSSGAGKTGE